MGRWRVTSSSRMRWGSTRVFRAEGEVRGSDYDWRAAERVRQADAQAPPADAGTHHHADRLIVEPARADGLRGGGGAGGGRRRGRRGARPGPPGGRLWRGQLGGTT